MAKEMELQQDDRLLQPEQNEDLEARTSAAPARSGVLTRGAAVFGALALVILVAGRVSTSQRIPSIATDGTVSLAAAAASTGNQSIKRSVYALEFPISEGSNVYFECHPEAGGMVKQFALNGINVIVDAPQPPSGNMGGTFWPSPQSAWGWPPPAAIAYDNYVVETDDDAQTITMQSEPDAQLGLKVTKRFSADLENKAIVAKYTITSTNSTVKQFAAWEKINVPPGGITFWESGERDTAPVTGRGWTTETTPVVEEDGITWFDHANTEINVNGTKLMTNTTSAWIAYVRHSVVFVKVSKSVPYGATAPGEGDVEIYAKPHYSTVETQGAYGNVTDEEPLVYTSCWYLRPLPEGAKAVKGDKKLLDFVQDIAKIGCSD